MPVTILWLDGELAKVFHFSEERMERDSISLDGVPSAGRESIEQHLRNSTQILLLSPGGEGSSLLEGLRFRAPMIAGKVVGVETLQTADDAAVAEYAVKYFRKPHKGIQA